jgi:hypothetical protein
LAVSEVTCRQAPTVTPSSGRSAANRSPIERSTGICASAHSIRARPSGARSGSRISLTLRASGPQSDPPDAVRASGIA